MYAWLLDNIGSLKQTKGVAGVTLFFTAFHITMYNAIGR